jgi:hypothetical protein
MPLRTIFSVDGPHAIPYYQGKAGRTLTDDNVDEFWEINSDIAKLRGCYVFGIRAGKGLTPGYVGRATKSFKQEVFSPHKLSRYQQFLADYGKGTPVMFFLVPPTKKGALNKKNVTELERFLIQTGVDANEDLMNIKGTKKLEEWGIAGVFAGGKGKASVAAKAFKQMMKL